MDNSISNSNFDLGSTTFNHIINGGINVTTIILILLCIAIVILAISIFAYVKYKRDKENVPNSSILNNLQTEINSLNAEFKTFKAANYELNKNISMEIANLKYEKEAKEKKDLSVAELHKSILELKKVIQEGGYNAK